MKKITNILLTIFCLLAAQQLYAQRGTIRGTVTDAETGETLIGVTVVIEGTTNGAPTDLDGKYTIEVDPGTYNLQVSYVSYETKTITGVEVTTGQVTVMDVKLGESSEVLQEIVVEAKAERNNEAAILTLQKKSSIVLDGISSQVFSKTGDNDAASAIRRVTGVSVEGGKYVYVRGLGDRYTKTTLNGAQIPSLDPTRNAVQLDIFPTNLIDNLVVYKTFSADLPGDFTGGLVNVITKDFPDRFTFQASASYSYNTNATFNDDFILYERSSTDWLGFDNGDRDIPSLAQGTIPDLGSAFGDPTIATQLDQITKSFNKIMEPSRDMNPFLGQRYSLSVGNQINLFGRPFGFIVGINYQNDYEFYDEGEVGQYVFSGSGGSALNNELLTEDTQGTQNVLLSGLVNISYKLSDKNKISLNVLRNQSGTSIARYQLGTFLRNFGEGTFFETRALGYLERNFNTFQLKGEHVIPSLAGLKIEWQSAYTISKQDEPDLRFFANDFQVISSDDTSFSISGSNYQIPTRFYRELNEDNWDNTLSFTFNFKAFGGRESKLKFGAAYLIKDRSFTERRLNYGLPSDGVTQFLGNIPLYLSDANLGITSQNPTRFGSVIQDATEARNTYNADQGVLGVFAMADLQLTSKLKLNIGARLETTDIEVVSKDENVPVGKLENTDILPAANFVWELKKDMNLRISYSRTIARPTFREIAPYASFTFVGDFVEVGNQNLERTLIDNADVRWEFYPRPGELFSASVFYKNFSNPIERVFDLRSANRELTYRNVDKGQVYGLELEFRKRLDFISPVLEDLQIGFNASFIESQIDIDSTELAQLRSANPDQESTRPLFAQSPYLINLIVDYNNSETGTEVSVSYNVFGERLSVVSLGTTPYVFERPRNTLNLSVSQKFGPSDRLKVTFRASNILNPFYNFAYEFRGQDYAFRKYKLGSDFSLGVSYSID
ncbi:MAG: TonB-dependent receptor [Microscillaceae bacterium]|nr:TonB-dependent receptor [Microscillaceae bacterium]